MSALRMVASVIMLLETVVTLIYFSSSLSIRLDI
jgi:hypothetical protein